ARRSAGGGPLPTRPFGTRRLRVPVPSGRRMGTFVPLAERLRRGERSVRIAIIAPPWVAVPPPAYGGTEAVLDGLARGLQAAGHDVLLCTTGDSTCPVPKSWVLPEAAGTVSTG